ncbi:hypothetical protein RHGRI_013878 [Rhododendron griersonianum]|uniref:Uncharacterized protein n=1 Tax=Rhododendron griersonianum TaxID=479676 RepID=A0AAV6K769_9ERIC|nr:hypothetical protein RHGRI_013878 [Rhododendron griersonianum]
MMERLGAGDLISAYVQEQTGDTDADGMLLPNNSQKILLSLPSSVSAGILKPESLDSTLGVESSGLSKVIGPLLDSTKKNTAQNPPTLTQTVPHSLHSPVVTPLLKSPTLSNSPNTNLSTLNTTNPFSSSISSRSTPPTDNPTINLIAPFREVCPTHPISTSQTQTQTQNFAFSALSEGNILAGVGVHPVSPRSKDSIPQQKKRGRPAGSKSKTDRSKGVTIPRSVSAASTDVQSSTAPAPRVGEKRSSSMGETKSTDLDGNEVCSPSKRPRITGNVLADSDSIMDDPISTETVEDASRDWPQRGT